MNVLHKINANEFNKNWRRKKGGKCSVNELNC